MKKSLNTIIIHKINSFATFDVTRYEQQTYYFEVYMKSFFINNKCFLILIYLGNLKTTRMWFEKGSCLLLVF